uniref:Uncharacterized protein n=1 Tax=Kalanchoe fedtschenkoi TaxID=63787 RepID=A0A7N1A930_KALFE
MATAADWGASLLFLVILLVSTPTASRSVDEPSVAVREVLATVAHFADSPAPYFTLPDSSEHHQHFHGYRSNPREAARRMAWSRRSSSAHLTLADLDRDNARVEWLNERLESALGSHKKTASQSLPRSNEKSATKRVEENEESRRAPAT